MAEGDFAKAMRGLLAVPWDAEKWRATRASETTTDRRRTRSKLTKRPKPKKR